MYLAVHATTAGDCETEQSDTTFSQAALVLCVMITGLNDL